MDEDEPVTTKRVAFHEAGHVASSYFLRVPFTYVTIIEDEDSAVHMNHGRMSATMVERIETASYNGYGGFVPAATRRWVESRVMVSLAGGLAAERAMGLKPTEVGSGLVELSDDEAAAMVAGHGGELGDWKTMIHGGDMETAVSFLEQLTGGNHDEVGPYMDWLIQRTVTLLGQHDVWLAVEAVAEALLDQQTLSAREARQVIRAALDADHQKYLATSRWASMGLGPG